MACSKYVGESDEYCPGHRRRNKHRRLHDMREVECPNCGRTVLTNAGTRFCGRECRFEASGLQLDTEKLRGGD